MPRGGIRYSTSRSGYPVFTWKVGPAPDELAGEGLAELAAVFAGSLACRAGRAEPNVPSTGVRRAQRAQLGVALPWAARALGIDEPKTANTHPQVQQ